MQPTRHPIDETLIRYAAATLGEGVRLVIGVHLAFCTQCRTRVETYEAIGGTVLDGLPPTTMASDAFAHVLQKIDAAEIRPRTRKRTVVSEIAPGIPVPAPLRDYAIGKWRFLAPGLQFRRITPAPDTQSTVLLLRGRAGAFLPDHGHGGDEYTCVLKGAFEDDQGRYTYGDIAVSDDSTQHIPRVSEDAECICLIVVEGGLKLRSRIGRLLQPLLGL